MMRATCITRRLLRVQHGRTLPSPLLLVESSPQQLAGAQHVTVKSQSRCMSNSAAATSIKLPPNLRFDPRSSFAPSRPRPSYDNLPTTRNEEEEVEDKDDGEEADPLDAVKSSEKEEKENEEEADPLENEEADPLDAMESSELDDDTDQYDDEDDEELFMAAPEAIYAVPLPERLHVDIHTLFAPDHSSKVGTIWLDESVFGHDHIRTDLLKRSVDYYRAKKRGRRKAVTKTISEVSGSGRKVRKQKGTGQARMGHSRPAHHRGGAKAHGPKNTTDYGNTKLNKKVRRMAVRHALSQKLLEGNLILLNQLHDLPTHKTGDLQRLLDPWDIGRRYGSSALILDHYHYVEGEEQNNNGDSAAGADEQQQPSYKGVPIRLWVASKNLPKITVGSDHDANVYNILKHEKLFMTLSALQVLESRLQGEVH